MTERSQWTSRGRADATARAVIECAADAIVAFGTDRTVMLWNPAAERMFGWTAAEVVGLEPQIIPEELKAEHNAVLERVRGGGQISFATRRIRKDGSAMDVRIDTSALIDAGGDVTGWVNVCHQAGEDDVARHYMAERARVVRRLGDVVADMNAQRDLESVLDRIAASLRELTGADAGGFVIIEDNQLRLVSTAGLPARLRGRTADLSTSLVGELMRSGKTVMMATGESGGFDDLIWSALPGLHTIALSLSHVGGGPTARCTRCTAGASCQPRRAGTARTAGRARRRGADQRDGVRGGRPAAGPRARGHRRQRGRHRRAGRRPAWSGSGTRPRTGSPGWPPTRRWARRHRSRYRSRGPSSPTGCPAGGGSTCCAPRWPAATSASSTSVT